MMKFAGKDWRDGIAMHYVVHIEDHFGKGFNPDFLFGYTGALKALTYKTLVLETLAPITLWFDSTRKATLVLVILFHLGIEMSMNLEMFHWIMVVGWSSFLAQPMVESKEEEPASSTAKLLDNKTGNSKEPEKKRLRRGGNLNQKKKRKK